MKLSLTRAIIDAIHKGTLADAPTRTDPVFGFEVVAECPGVPADVLWPENTWDDKAAFRAAAENLKGLFEANYTKFTS